MTSAAAPAMPPPRAAANYSRPTTADRRSPSGQLPLVGPEHSLLEADLCGVLIRPDAATGSAKTADITATTS